MRTHAFRLEDGCDLRMSLEQFVKEHGITAGYIMTCVGGLSRAVLRMPGAKEFLTLDEDLEIVSIQGTLSSDGCHIHLAVSDKDGRVFGGHLTDGSIVRLTSEMIVGEADDYKFTREYDSTTGFNELVIRQQG